MYGDTSVIRRLARELRERGVDIRAQARALHGKLESTNWTGDAAEAMRREATWQLSHLDGVARRHDDAADALERHADEVDRLKDLIAAIERAAHRLIAAARERLADVGRAILDGLGSVMPDPVDQLIADFVAPPPGHRDWLGVDLVGLGD